MRGLTHSTNSMGIEAVRLHYTADPDKDPQNPDLVIAKRAQEWLDQQRARYPDPNDFAREMEISFYSGKGQRVYPQFTMDNHVRELEYNKRKVIYRAWDFGWHTPCCLVAQIHPQDRLVFLREIVGSKETTHEFASKVVAMCESWFPNHAPGYEDFCDPAGQQQKSIASELNERRDVEVLAGLCIHAKYEYGWSKKDQRTLVHRLLALRADGTPSLFTNAAWCELLNQSFLGRYVYPESKLEKKVKDEPDDDTHPWADLQACVRYMVTGLHKRLNIMSYALNSQPSYQPTPAYTGYGLPKRG